MSPHLRAEGSPPQTKDLATSSRRGNMETAAQGTFQDFVLRQGFSVIALAILELVLETRLASDLEIRLPVPPECLG